MPTKKPKRSSAAAPPPSTPLDVEFTSQAEEDRRWFARRQPGLLERINALIEDTRRHPFTGLGKPEPLRFDLAGKWSRRITDEHRLVYRVAAGAVIVLQLRFHYDRKR